MLGPNLSCLSISTQIISRFVQGILTAPKPFKCSITPRSQGRADIIEREFTDAIGTFLRFEENLEEGEKRWIQETRKF